MGGSGYIGGHFSKLCNELDVKFQVIDPRRNKFFNFTEKDIVVDFSMLNRYNLPKLEAEAFAFNQTHDLVLDEVIKTSCRYIRISSIFDVRPYLRNDPSTILTRQISRKVLDKAGDLSTVIYLHAVYGGENSKSFIDLPLSSKSFFYESLRDYLYVMDVGTALLDFILNSNNFYQEIEFGTSKPYLSSEICKYLESKGLTSLYPIQNNSQTFRILSEQNAICSSSQTRIRNIETKLLPDRLQEYLKLRLI